MKSKGIRDSHHVKENATRKWSNAALAALNMSFCHILPHQKELYGIALGTVQL